MTVDSKNTGQRLTLSLFPPLKNKQLAWFHKDRRLLLALDNKTVAWRERLHVSSHANSVFFLQLESVQLSDKVSSAFRRPAGIHVDDHQRRILSARGGQI